VAVGVGEGVHWTKVPELSGITQIVAVAVGVLVGVGVQLITAKAYGITQSVGEAVGVGVSVQRINCPATLYWKHTVGVAV
jgi:hypothetical protein